tara:strand:- start:566 stop:796 length:231 start_codon:yes stop_codon:yes gene_type:complete
VDELSEDTGLKVVGRVPRNAIEEVVVTMGTYRLIDVLDIRWYKDNRPSHKGIRVNREEAQLLYAILKRELEVNRNE